MMMLCGVRQTSNLEVNVCLCMHTPHIYIYARNLTTGMTNEQLVG